jgi:AcrR family transcriptional regulator
MLLGMRALPGRDLRTGLAEPGTHLTRETVSDAQRRRIRRATGELVAKRGYAGVTVGLIVKRARVSFKTFYKHYANKEEAFVDLFDTTVEATRAHIEAGLTAEQAEWPDRVALALRLFFEAIIAEPLISRAILVEGPTAGPAILGRYEGIAKAFVPILREGRDYSPEAAKLPQTIEDTLAGAVLWSAYQRLNFSEADRIAELIPENIELVLRPYIGEAEASRIAAASLAGTSPA